jgi:hypothetical protein
MSVVASELSSVVDVACPEYSMYFDALVLAPAIGVDIVTCGTILSLLFGGSGMHETWFTNSVMTLCYTMRCADGLFFLGKYAARTLEGTWSTAHYDRGTQNKIFSRMRSAAFFLWLASNCVVYLGDTIPGAANILERLMWSIDGMGKIIDRATRAFLDDHYMLKERDGWYENFLVTSRFKHTNREIEDSVHPFAAGGDMEDDESDDESDDDESDETRSDDDTESDDTGSESGSDGSSDANDVDDGEPTGRQARYISVTVSDGDYTEDGSDVSPCPNPSPPIPPPTNCVFRHEPAASDNIAGGSHIADPVLTFYPQQPPRLPFTLRQPYPQAARRGQPLGEGERVRSDHVPNE